MATFTIIATKSNPDRAAEAGFPNGAWQISHWVADENGMPENLHKLDAWVPSIEDAVQWVSEHYPSARVTKVREVAGNRTVLSYIADISDLKSY